jgi:hypothetical protein
MHTDKASAASARFAAFGTLAIAIFAFIRVHLRLESLACFPGQMVRVGQHPWSAIPAPDAVRQAPNARG